MKLLRNHIRAIVKRMNPLRSSKNGNRTSSARPKLLAKRDLAIASLLLASVSAVIFSTDRKGVEAQAGPTMLDPSLAVKTVVSGLVTPISMAFLGNNDMLVLEKNTGRVKRVVKGVVKSTVLDLGVNYNSEGGLLAIALHPASPATRGVSLSWPCRSTAPPADPFFPDQLRCS